MKSRNDYVPARHSFESGIDARTWRWIALAHLCMLVAFAGMSLVAIAVVMLSHGGDVYAIATPGMAGAALTILGWLGVARVVGSAERQERQTARASVTARPAAAQPRITGMTPTL